MKTNAKYEISVIIPTYNRSRLLSFTIDSLVKQKLDKNKFEIIICDDGSNDDTSIMLEKYKDKLNLKYIFQEDKGYRPASSRNNGIRISEGEICLFIDSSVILDDNCLNEHLNFHCEKDFPRAAIGYVYGFDHEEQSDEVLRSLIDTEDIQNSIQRLQWNNTYLDIREISYIKYNDQIEALPAPWYYFWTCHLSVRTSSLKKVGLFDENYDGRWGVEDNDLGFRLHQSGVKIQLLRSAKSIHFPHDKNKLERIIEGFENRVYFHEKFGTPETGLFLDIFDATCPEYIDMNDLILEQSQFNSTELKS